MIDREIQPKEHQGQPVARMARRRFLRGAILLTAGSALLAACAPAAAPAAKPTEAPKPAAPAAPAPPAAAAKPTEAAKPAQAAPAAASGGDTIKIGVLHSLSGTMAISET